MMGSIAKTNVRNKIAPSVRRIDLSKTRLLYIVKVCVLYY